MNLDSCSPDYNTLNTDSINTSFKPLISREQLPMTSLLSSNNLEQQSVFFEPDEQPLPYPDPPSGLHSLPTSPPKELRISPRKRKTSTISSGYIPSASTGSPATPSDLQSLLPSPTKAVRISMEDKDQHQYHCFRIYPFSINVNNFYFHTHAFNFNSHSQKSVFITRNHHELQYILQSQKKLGVPQER